MDPQRTPPGAGSAGQESRIGTAGLLRELARPRLTGSEGAEAVTAFVRERFEETGYAVEDRPFTFNPLPGRFGVTAIGVLYLAATVGASVLLWAGRPFAAMSLLLVLLVATGLLAFFAPSAINSLAWGERQGVNLFATPPSGRPRYIVMAHRDSKSQPVRLAFRGPAIALGVIMWLALLAAAAVYTARPLPGPLLLAIGVAAALAGITLVFCWTGNESPGALDNASGVAAAIGLAHRERENDDVAFLITDAEELGLAGSRAEAGRLPPVFGVINLDGLDDDGSFYVLERFGTVRRQGLAPHLAAALLEEAASRDEPIERRDLPFGILVDHIPIVKSGQAALTVMRGSLRSLRRVHSPEDSLDHLRGEGVERTVELVSGALRRLRERAPGR